MLKACVTVRAGVDERGHVACRVSPNPVHMAMLAQRLMAEARRSEASFVVDVETQRETGRPPTDRAREALRLGADDLGRARTVLMQDLARRGDVAAAGALLARLHAAGEAAQPQYRVMIEEAVRVHSWSPPIDPSQCTVPVSQRACRCCDRCPETRLAMTRIPAESCWLPRLKRRKVGTLGRPPGASRSVATIKLADILLQCAELAAEGALPDVDMIVAVGTS